ncbi:hypothetical protein CkaCkLH20_00663 [Colletotrichum karsti]|uniref:Uncharacterized protein n=1 Tax=Colletotrichum karsti TaxID=1095194 RepID=A0A9P6IDP9_9PEZI|nr:uncharacterized protein CkaCkLH20_00663 [Colletotrichum karsti]KAF9881517.1 hypothetical protein CkaCkLH20_00663 [Colletotrichum karsti]
MPPTKSLLAVLALIPLATSQSSSSSEPVREITSNAQGPYYIPNDPWTSSFSSPSYSSLYPFDAPDVSQPYPAPVIAGWSVSVAVQDNIPLTSATPNQLNATERAKFIAGVRVALNPPPSLRVGGGDGAWKLDASWRVCYSQPSLLVNGTIMRRLASDDGSCGGLWSASCLRGIEASMLSAWTTKQDFDLEDGCPFSIPSICGAPDSSGFTTNSITAGEAFAWGLGDSGVGSARGVQVMGWGTEPGAEGDREKLELARGFVNPLIIAFGPGDRSRAEKSEVKVQIICPRAKEEGEVGPGQSEGTGLRIDMALVLGLALGLASYLV